MSLDGNARVESSMLIPIDSRSLRASDARGAVWGWGVWMGIGCERMGGAQAHSMEGSSSKSLFTVSIFLDESQRGISCSLCVHLCDKPRGTR